MFFFSVIVAFMAYFDDPHTNFRTPSEETLSDEGKIMPVFILPDLRGRIVVTEIADNATAKGIGNTTCARRTLKHRVSIGPDPLASWPTFRYFVIKLLEKREERVPIDRIRCRGKRFHSNKALKFAARFKVGVQTTRRRKKTHRTQSLGFPYPRNSREQTVRSRESKTPRCSDDRPCAPLRFAFRVFALHPTD
jgi:hypothetical protein